jgi:hypothetical protein
MSNPLEDDMAGTTRIPKADLTGVKGALVKRMSRKMLGACPSRSRWRGTTGRC